MKKFALMMIFLSIGLIIYNLSTLDFSASLTSVRNQQVYINLAGNVLILVSLVLSYLRYSKGNKSQSQQ